MMKTKIITGKDYQGKMYYAIHTADGKTLRAGYPTRREAEREQQRIDRTTR